MSKFTAVYGGSFDPPHIGHVMVVSHLLNARNRAGEPAERILTHAHPVFEVREVLPRLLKAGHHDDPRDVGEVQEQQLGGESLTLRTMQELDRQGEKNLRFVIGSDLLESCKTWEGWAELEALAPPLPIGRAGISPTRVGDPTPISPAMSSSIVRGALALNDEDTVWRYVPREVLQYIKHNRLYTH